MGKQEEQLQERMKNKKKVEVIDTLFHTRTGRKQDEKKSKKGRKKSIVHSSYKKGPCFFFF